MTDWTGLQTELRIWYDEGLAMPLWWRDDDAVAQTTALDQMVARARDLNMPVHIAVIPKHADQSLVDVVLAEPKLVPLVHGWAHENHATPGQKKSEFAEPRAAQLAEASAAIARMKSLFGTSFAEIFVPPWNRIDPALIPQLPALGYAGLSTFTPRLSRLATGGLVQINTHIDPIDWRGGGGLRAPAELLNILIRHLQDRRAGQADTAEPLGMLTHHLVQDEETWRFTLECLSRLMDAGAVPIDLQARLNSLP
ncbi:polysaccharide deacetylase [Sulfitobacter sp. M57]|uniref:polysaccharide deacetylase family protein n=1 Tax=unclassified Sulfitobacter TaxID=196795 RepID=UPI0023E1F17A|nr:MULTISPECIES: polysaccharide deacetylase family protein [unclassified Sulfitobacter]MDF3415944.1 polysaccharide deacetylase [Sulfitobacter sp. KE5]MDF3423424.1 polysaccharide deacetylase [Sulfitobacter sp. KE43]MDF3434490.1 polysaccharide deacetylase [Sulfitobacter sp. KE42]MDF3460130.1 polysaccharide deacetylase [Sulfitobacter sp. S74]MDF3464028.1 polysaccharide deacetylase [Sulfitobacter sp. Ks18]